MTPRRSPLLLTFVMWGVCMGACTEPKERATADQHLKKALQLAAQDPQGALAELAQSKGATASQRAYVEGLTLEGQKRFGEAAAALQRAVDADPNGLQPRTALGRVQIIVGQTKAAQENLKKVIKKDPGALPAILLLVVCEEDEATKSIARQALESWPMARPQAEKQVPLRAEYFLALATVAKDPASRQSALAKSKNAEVGSISAATTLAQFAVLTKKLSLASRLIARLAGSEASPEQLQTIASVALSMRATESAGRALSRIPGNVRTPKLLALRGRYELFNRHPKRAIAHFIAALGLVNEGDEALKNELEYYIASAHRADRNPQDAVKILSGLVKRSPNHRATQFLLSEIELQGGKMREAVTRLTTLSEKHPKDANVHRRLGDALMRAKKHEKAEAHYREALRLAPDDARLPHRMIESLRRRGDDEAALAFVRQMRKNHPQSVPLVRAEVTQLVRMKKRDEAKAVAEKAATQLDDQVGIQLLLADTYDTLGQQERVAEVLEKLVVAEKQSARAWSALARLQGRNKDYTAMEASLRTVVRLAPQALKDKARLATLLNQTGKKKEAAALFAELAETAESDVVALNNAAMLYAGELNDPRRAVEFAERAYSLAPGNLAIMDTLGWALLKKGDKTDRERALTLLRRAFEGTDSPEIAFHFGMAMQATGKPGEAKKIIEKALASPRDGAWRKEAEAALRK